MLVLDGSNERTGWRQELGSRRGDIAHRLVYGFVIESRSGCHRASIDRYVGLLQWNTNGPIARGADQITVIIAIIQCESLTFALARVADTPTRTLELPRRELHEFVRGYTDGAAFVNDRRSCVVSWNAFANELFDFSGVPARECNMLALMVRRSRTREVFVDAHEAIARMIGVFRVTCAECVDPQHDALVAELRAESAEFDRLWQAFTINALIAHICVLRHERLGEVRMQFMAFTPVDHPDHTVVTLRERGPTRSRAKNSLG